MGPLSTAQVLRQWPRRTGAASAAAARVAPWHARPAQLVAIAGSKVHPQMLLCGPRRHWQHRPWAGSRPARLDGSVQLKAPPPSGFQKHTPCINQHMDNKASGLRKAGRKRAALNPAWSGRQVMAAAVPWTKSPSEVPLATASQVKASCVSVARSYPVAVTASIGNSTNLPVSGASAGKNSSASQVGSSKTFVSVRRTAKVIRDGYAQPPCSPT